MQDTPCRERPELLAQEKQNPFRTLIATPYKEAYSTLKGKIYDKAYSTLMVIHIVALAVSLIKAIIVTLLQPFSYPLQRSV